MKSEEDELNAPKFSTAIGWKIRLVGKLLYVINFRSAANSATIPTPAAALSTYDCASMLIIIINATEGKEKQKNLQFLVYY